MHRLYALVGGTTNDVLTFQGAVIVHENQSEMEWLFPMNRVVEFRPGSSDTVMALKNHPSMASVTFPLTKSDFRDSV